MIRALIADDEPLCRDGIRQHMTRHPDVTVLGEAADGDEAVALAAELQPELMFLDVQMPALDGFGVVEALARSTLPTIVFVTAHDRFAMRAFDVHALDYLLKPFTPARFDEALQRARDEIASAGAHESRRRMLQLVAERSLEARRTARFLVRHGEREVIVPAVDVDAFEADGNYVQLRTASGSFMIRMTMAELETKLDPERFVRIHRSTIVNVARIADVTPAWHGDFEVRLADGRRLRLSRNFRDRLLP